ncbi:MAG: TonB-dependent receptor, partial [Sporomusa sp.]|nr:TonB-dependent receptor [Sporomusa sp.]
QGVEFELSRKANEHFNYFMNYTYLDVGDMTRWSSEHKGNVGVSYKNRQMKASLMQQYVGTSYDEDLKTNPNAAKIDAYSITNLKVTYTPSEQYEMSLGVENLFNRYYETYRYDPMPGRAYTISLTSRF